MTNPGFGDKNLNVIAGNIGFDTSGTADTDAAR